MKHGLPLTERIERYSIPEPNSGCWLWIASDSNGYGNIRLEGRTERAHRMSWKAFCGPIPNGMHVLHRCDTPACVNPSHLFLGTDQDNNDDKERKGRGNQLRGERHWQYANPHAKLSKKMVLEIRTSKLNAKIASKLYGVTQATIYNIRKRTRWSHI